MLLSSCRPCLDSSSGLRLSPRSPYSLGRAIKEAIQFGRSSAARQHLESPIRGNLARGPGERAPGRQRETGTDRDPAHPEVGKLSQRQLRIESGNEDVNRFRSNCPNDRADLLGRARARSVKTISAGFGVGHETLKRCPQRIGMIHQKRFATASQNELCAGFVDCTTCG